MTRADLPRPLLQLVVFHDVKIGRIIPAKQEKSKKSVVEQANRSLNPDSMLLQPPQHPYWRWRWWYHQNSW